MPSRESFRAYTLGEAQKGNLSRPLRVYADGVFDLFHFGHIEYLRQLKAAFPAAVIVAGVIPDAEVVRFKGAYPVMTAEERGRSLEACGLVDEIHYGVDYHPSIALLDRLRVDILAHDALPYPAPNTTDVYRPFKDVDR